MAEIFNTNISHCIKFPPPMSIFPLCITMQTTFLTCSAKENDLEFCCKIHLQKQKYSLHFRKQTAILIMLMNHDTTQPCRVLRLAQASMFTPQILKADNASITLVYQTMYWSFSRWELLSYILVGSTQTTAYNMVRIFRSINFTRQFRKGKMFFMVKTVRLYYGIERDIHMTG